MSSTKILQPSCSPKKLTLLPTTGPRSSRMGDSRVVSEARNLRSALVPKTGSSPGADAPGAPGAGASSSFLRGAMRPNSPTGDRVQGSAFTVQGSRSGSSSVLVLGSGSVLIRFTPEPRTLPEPLNRDPEP